MKIIFIFYFDGFTAFKLKKLLKRILRINF
jgi:hypothetical protein